MTEVRENRVIVTFRNDDPSGISDVAHERHVAEVFERFGVPQTIGVIPRCAIGPLHDPTPCGEVSLVDNREMVGWLRTYAAASGSEVALHGFTHRTNRFSRPARREYFEFRGMGMNQQADWIAQGAAILEQALGVRPCTFVPPWNRLDVNTVHACVKNGIAIISAGAFAPVQDGVLSFGTDCYLWDFPSLLEHALRGDRRVFLRVLYHSSTIRTAEELATLEHVVGLAARTAQCQVLTVRETVQQFRDEVREVNEAARNVVSQSDLQGSARARAMIYRRIGRHMGMAGKLERAYRQAEEYYGRGNYRRAHGMSARLDEMCARMVIGARSAIALSTCVLLCIVGMIGSDWSVSYRAAAYAAAGTVLAAISLVAQWYATAPDTKRESRVAVLSTLIGVAGGIGVAELLLR